MKISIVVPAFNEERLLGATLDSIQAAAQAFTLLGWIWELIVCNNNSTDGTADLARSRGAKVVFEPVNQISRARNTGAKAATGDWLLFIDADSHPSLGLFAQTADLIRSGECLAGGSAIRLQGENRKGHAVVLLWNLVSRTFKLLAGSYIFCEANAFRDAGGFSEELFIGEELELSRKLKKLARERKKRFVILREFPLLTSDRKIRLYGKREHLRFLLKTALTFGKTKSRREDCFTWYDGRR